MVMILLLKTESFKSLLKFTGKAEKEPCYIDWRLIFLLITGFIHRNPYDNFSIMFTASYKENI